MKNTYNILSLDGGGLRGLITAVLLERLEASRPGFLASVDLVAGTSTGGILALALAKGLPPSTLATIYLGQGETIFNRPLSRRLGSLLGVARAKYDNDGLAGVLKRFFGDTRLYHLDKRVAVTAFDLDDEANLGRTWRPKVFHNYPGEGTDRDELALDVALRTSAAPTYFPSVDGYVDGGVFANNPSMVALAQAFDARYFGDGAVRNLANVRLLSVGTGANLKHLAGARLDWGIAEWAAPLLSVLMDGVADVADFQCRQLLGNQYHRLQLDFPEEINIPMDSVADLGNMLQLAQAATIRDTLRWIGSSGWGDSR